MSDIIEEIAGIRLVLVHMLARLPLNELTAISESISHEWRAVETSAEAESGLAPYRQAADEILAHAVKISESRGEN